MSSVFSAKELVMLIVKYKSIKTSVYIKINLSLVLNVIVLVSSVGIT
ncbi:hypothetical protein THF1D04_50103 [Vibrio owensii]|uniref:YnhF family membrane protein n=1 Tax=Vibrio owensii TaxID=696485 RepID=A0AAU9QCE6_9VIBR|nr:hypothetical protein THF1D04_50103 [Vibrio owensii]